MLDDKINQYSLTQYDMLNLETKKVGEFTATEIENRFIVDIGFVRDIDPSNDNKDKTF